MPSYTCRDCGMNCQITMHSDGPEKCPVDGTIAPWNEIVEGMNLHRACFGSWSSCPDKNMCACSVAHACSHAEEEKAGVD